LQRLLQTRRTLSSVSLYLFPTTLKEKLNNSVFHTPTQSFRTRHGERERETHTLQQTSKLFFEKKINTTEKAAQKPPQAKRITELPRLQPTNKTGRKECGKARSMFLF
jgi:hypothetical protein